MALCSICDKEYIDSIMQYQADLKKDVDSLKNGISQLYSSLEVFVCSERIFSKYTEDDFIKYVGSNSSYKNNVFNGYNEVIDRLKKANVTLNNEINSKKEYLERKEKELLLVENELREIKNHLSNGKCQIYG